MTALWAGANRYWNREIIPGLSTARVCAFDLPFVGTLPNFGPYRASVPAVRDQVEDRDWEFQAPPESGCKGSQHCSFVIGFLSVSRGHRVFQANISWAQRLYNRSDCELTPSQPAVHLTGMSAYFQLSCKSPSRDCLWGRNQASRLIRFWIC